MPYQLRDVEGEHKKKLKVSIKCNRLDYSREIITVTLRTILDGIKTAIEALLVNDCVEERSKLTVQVVLVVQRNRLAALLQLAYGNERYNWQSEGLQM